MITPHHNQQLFSDHYLNVTLEHRDDWMSLIGEYEVEVVREKITALFKKYKPSDKEKEAQTEEEFVKPVLKILGHTFAVQASLATPGKAQTPDYIFYRDQDAQEANKGKMLNESLLASKAFAIGDAKSWNRPLDRAPTTEGKERDLFTNKNPTYQIAFYIQHSGLDWGILTNGRLWRLYHKDTAHKLDHYYDVDLPELLEHGSSREFLYFYIFFRRAAFDQHPLSISNILKESMDNATTLKDIYDNSLILLYRLLFILYAEARNLLPMYDSAVYAKKYSLRSITEEIGQDLSAGTLLRSNSTRIYHHLKELFGYINLGDQPLKISSFNGGLFDPEQHSFLEYHMIADAWLQQAIDMLARVDGQSIDYRDLSVRNVGTIYEGLLEYHLENIEANDGWSIDLLNEKGERKSLQAASACHCNIG